MKKATAVAYPVSSQIVLKYQNKHDLWSWHIHWSLLCQNSSTSRCGINSLGSESWQGKYIFSTPKASGLALGHTKPPIQWAPEFFPGVRIWTLISI